MEIAGQDADRYDRSRRFFGEDRLQRIRASKALVVGAGAVGNEVCKNLGLLGIGKMVLVDHDKVSGSNLNRCALFRPGDVGRSYKVRAVRRSLASIAPDTEVNAVAKPIQEAPLDVWDVDVAVLCVDNDYARYFANTTLLSLGRRVPIVSGAMARTFVEVRTAVPHETSCLVCHWDEAYFQRVMAEEVRKQCDEFFVETVPRFPAIAVLNSLVGGMMSVEIVKLLAYAGDEQEPLAPSSGKLLRYDVAKQSSFCAEVSRNPECVEVMCRSS